MEIKSNLLNKSKIFDNLKQSIIAVSKTDNKQDWRVKLVEYINIKAYQEQNKFFYDKVPFMIFVPKNHPVYGLTKVAKTDSDGIIYMNAPDIIGENIKFWDFIFCHECLHQLWNTFKVQEKIVQKDGKYNHAVLNVASDCVINDYLYRVMKKDIPDDLITPKYLKETFNIDYDYKKDTQYTLYYKLLSVKNEVKNDKLCQKNNQQFDDTIDPKEIQQNDSSSNNSEDGQSEQHSEDYIKGWTDGIQDTLDGKVDPLTYQPKSGKDDYTQGYNDVLDKIKEGMERGISMSSSSDNSNSNSGSDLPNIPWNQPQSSGSSSPSEQAQNSADNAKKSADQAKKNADNINKSKSASKDEKQEAENAAKDAENAAKEAQESADKAKDLENKGDIDGAKKEAENAAQSEQDAGTSSSKTSTPKQNSETAQQSAKNAQEYADEAKKMADKLNSAAKAAKGKDKKELQEAADYAKECAENAQDAADKAKEAANKAKEAAQKGNAEAAKEATDEALKQENKAKGEFTKSIPGEKTQKAFNDNNEESSNGQGGNNEGDHDIFVISKEERENLRKRNSELLQKYGSKIAGTFGEFIKKCQSSVACDKNGLEVNVRRGNHGWSDRLESNVCAYVETKVQELTRKYKRTYSKMYRRAGYVKPGQFIPPGKKRVDERLLINPTFYVDISGSMGSGGRIDNVWKCVYTIGEALTKQFSDMSIVEDVKFQLKVFDTKIQEIKWGNKASAGGGTLPFEDFLKDVAESDKEHLLVIIFTDADFGGNNEKIVEEVINKCQSMIYFITCKDNPDIKKVADKHKDKLYYTVVPNNFNL